MIAVARSLRRQASGTRREGIEINVETSQGSVVIRSKVDSDVAKQAAEGITKGIDGVKSVKNDLQVIAPAKRETIDDKVRPE